MYEYELMAQLKKDEVEQMASRAWKYHPVPKESSVKSLLKRLFDRKAAAAKDCNCSCVC